MILLKRLAAVAALSVAIVLPAHAQPKPGHLDEVLRKLDASSASFKSAEADFRWDLFDHTVHDTTTQTGTIYFKKDGGKVQMGAKIASPAPTTLEFHNSILRMYQPGIDKLTVINSGKNQAVIESFLTLGFGGSGKDLERAWKLSDLGEETVDGVNTAKIDLVPKDPATQNICTHIIIWLDQTRGVSLKQELFEPDQDTRTSYYTNIRLNQNVDEGKYAIKTTKNTTVDNR